MAVGKDNLDSIEQKDALEICRQLNAEATNAKAAANCLDPARRLVESFPELHEPNLTLMMLKEKSRAQEDMLESWLEMNGRFPDCVVSQRFCVRWYYRLGQIAEARKFIELVKKKIPSSAADVLNIGLLHIEVRDYEKSDAALRKGIDDYADSQQLVVILCRNLTARGRINEAWLQLQPVLTGDGLPSSVEALRNILEPAVKVLDQLAPDNWRKHDNTGQIAHMAAIKLFQQRQICPSNIGRIGPTTLITGSLAGGGAERQMVNTAMNLERLRQEKGALGDIALDGPFRLAVTTLGSTRKKSFLLPLVQTGDVPVDEIHSMDVVPEQEICPDLPEISALIPILPSTVLFGVRRLVAYFHKHQTETAFIWQDGAVLQVALAALIAGVPQLILNARNLPPNRRGQEDSDDYRQMYQALAEVPGVSFASNSRSAAQAYCSWMDIPVDRFEIVPNGVVLPPAKDVGQDTQMWADFAEATLDATRTIGGVFRFNAAKRPLLWVSFASEYLKRHPYSRFVIVGGGNLLDDAKEKARLDGIDHRILFVGASTDVAYWLGRMDVSVLLSLYEGLPNVLIEAQMAGIPVVSTPAGSAAETYINGQTGILLPDAEHPALTEICDGVDAAYSLTAKDGNLRQKAMQFANETFSLDQMIENTVSLLHRP